MIAQSSRASAPVCASPETIPVLTATVDSAVVGPIHPLRRRAIPPPRRGARRSQTARDGAPGSRGRGLRPQTESLLARHGNRRAPAHSSEPGAHLVLPGGHRPLGAQAAAVDRDRTHGAARRLRSPPGRRGVRLQEVPLGYADRRGVLAPGPQRPPPREHQRGRQGSGHRFRSGSPHHADRALPRTPMATSLRARRDLSVLRAHHQHPRDGVERGPRPRGAPPSLLARPHLRQPAGRVEEGPPQVRALLPLQLRPLSGARRAVLLEGAARERDGRGAAGRLLGLHDLLRARGARREELPAGDAGSRARPLVRDADRVDQRLRGQPTHLGPLRRARPSDRTSPVPDAAAPAPARDRARSARHLRKWGVHTGPTPGGGRSERRSHTSETWPGRPPGGRRPARSFARWRDAARSDSHAGHEHARRSAADRVHD